MALPAEPVNTQHRPGALARLCGNEPRALRLTGRAAHARAIELAHKLAPTHKAAP
jgi:hypothetical protein